MSVGEGETGRSDYFGLQKLTHFNRKMLQIWPVTILQTFLVNYSNTQNSSLQFDFAGKTEFFHRNFIPNIL